MTRGRKYRVIVTPDEFVALMKQTKHLHHKVAFILAFGGGLRVSEVCDIEKRDIDFKLKRILVRQGKGGKDRIIPLPKGFKESHLKNIPIKIGVRALQRAFKNACKKAGLLKNKPSLHFHSLRHGFASRLAGEGVPIHHVKILMGHSNISTTNVYLEENPKEAIKWYEEVF